MNDLNWRNKLNRARLVEQSILGWWRQNVDKDARLSKGYCPEYDIFSPNGAVEVKEDRLAHQTNYYALEYETHDGQPSGVEVTTAKYFVIVDWENVSIMETNLLKEIIASCDRKKSVLMGEVFPNGKRNRGWLIPRRELLNHPCVTKIKRWFPVSAYG